MTVDTVKKLVPGDFILMEQPANHSREACPVPAGETLAVGQVCKTNAAGKKVALGYTGNETHRYAPTGTATEGRWGLTLRHKDGYWVETGDIAYNATNTDIQNAINAVLGASAVTITGTLATQVDIQFTGTDYAQKTWALGYAKHDELVGVTAFTVTRHVSAGAARDEVQRVKIAGSVSAGSFKLGIPMLDGDGKPSGAYAWTDTIPHNATWSTVITNINTALDDLLGSGVIVANAVPGSSYSAGFDLTFSGTGYAGLAFGYVQIDLSGLTGATIPDISRVTGGGLIGEAVDNRADSICLEAAAPVGSDGTAVFLVRQAEVNAENLVYGGGDPAGCAAGLKDTGIITRSASPLRSFGT